MRCRFVKAFCESFVTGGKIMSTNCFWLSLEIERKECLFQFLTLYPQEQWKCSLSDANGATSLQDALDLGTIFGTCKHKRSLSLEGLKTISRKLDSARSVFSKAPLLQSQNDHDGLVALEGELCKTDRCAIIDGATQGCCELLENLSGKELAKVLRR